MGALPGGRLEAGESPEECVAREVRDELGPVVEAGPLLDAWVYEPLPERWPTGALWRRLAGWRIAPRPRLWDLSGYARVVRAWAAMSQKDRPGF
jgi:ADP-ribose pyrophosphatase YjhB (NUDIX family)